MITFSLDSLLAVIQRRGEPIDGNWLITGEMAAEAKALDDLMGYPGPPPDMEWFEHRLDRKALELMLLLDQLKKGR
jgi:hypothetical protein